MTLHIHAQTAPHDEAYIIGDIQSLLGLKDAIDRAVTGQVSVMTDFTADGEGYELIILVEAENSPNFKLVPYTSSLYNTPESVLDTLEPEKVARILSLIKTQHKTDYPPTPWT